MEKNRSAMMRENESLFLNSQVETDFQIELSGNAFPFIQGTSRFSKAMISVCLNGEVEVEVDMVNYHIGRDTFLMLFPGQIVNLKSTSEDFEVMYFAVSADTFHDVLFRFPVEFTTFLKKHVIYHDNPDNIEKERVRFEMLRTVFDDKENVCRREILLNLTRVYYLGFYNDIYLLLKRNPQRRSRQSELFERFVNSVMENYKTSREVLFYANKLNISVKYLSMIVQNEDNRNAKKWIDDYVVSEIKIRLQSSNESLQDIAFDLDFADQSFLSKYFKRQTGISLTKYRKSII